MNSNKPNGSYIIEELRNFTEARKLHYKRDLYGILDYDDASFRNDDCWLSNFVLI